MKVSDKEIHLKIRCEEFSSTLKVPLETDSRSYQVQKKAQKIIVTRFGYYGSKIQTQNDKFHQLRVPYVKEIVRLQFNKDKTLSFYKEDFAIDSLGRVTSQGQWQAYSLKPQKMKASVEKNKSKQVSIEFVSRGQKGS